MARLFAWEANSLAVQTKGPPGNNLINSTPIHSRRRRCKRALLETERALLGSQQPVRSCLGSPHHSPKQ
jgi:hypothetical protein